MTPESAVAEPAARPGRKRDHTRDADILEATLDVLATEGYDGMTIDMVASRAGAGKATVYRRWPSKEDLVIDAIACMKGTPTPDELPDTGSLRGDLIAMLRPPVIRDADMKLKIMVAMASLMTRYPEFAQAARAAVIEPRTRATRALLQRAMERGEIPRDIDIELVAQIGPSMAANRTVFLQRPVDRAYMIEVIDKIVLPAVGLRAEPGDPA